MPELSGCKRGKPSMSSKDMTNNNMVFMPPAVLPDGHGGFTPCPDLLTEDEAIRFLRLDGIETETPSNTLRYYRKKGLLRATQVGKCIRYRRIELEKLLERLTDTNPR
jgi:hypothetical protein